MSTASGGRARPEILIAPPIRAAANSGAHCQGASTRLKVTLLLQGRYDIQRTRPCASVYGALLSAVSKSRVGRVLHAKVAVIDGQLATVGCVHLIR